MATIYQCMYRDRRMTVGCAPENQGKRDKCKGCKGPMMVFNGHAIIARHRGDGNYSMDDAIREFSTLTAANRAAQRLYEADPSSNVVARFVL